MAATMLLHFWDIHLIYIMSLWSICNAYWFFMYNLNFPLYSACLLHPRNAILSDNMLNRSFFKFPTCMARCWFTWLNLVLNQDYLHKIANKKKKLQLLNQNWKDWSIHKLVNHEQESHLLWYYFAFWYQFSMLLHSIS